MSGYGGQQPAGYGGQQPAPVEMQPTNEQPPVEEIHVDGDQGAPAKKKHSEAFMKCKKSFTITMLVFAIFSGGLALISAYQANQIMNAYSSDYSDAADSFKAKPYLDVVLSDTGNCPTGYEKVAGYTWPGLQDHCNCVRNESMTDHVGSCSSDEIEDDCFSVSGLDSFSLHSILPNNVAVCGLKGSTAAVDRPIPQSGTCTSGNNKCGGEDDAFLFCYPQETSNPKSQFSCPITDLLLEELIVDSSSNTTSNTTALEAEAGMRAATLDADGFTCSETSGVCAFFKHGNKLNYNLTSRGVVPVGIWGFPLITIWSTSGIPCYLDPAGDSWRGYKNRNQEYNSMQDNFRSTTTTQVPDSNWYSRGFVLNKVDTGCKWSTAPEDPENGLASGVTNNPNNWDVRWVATYSRLERDILSPYQYNGTWGTTNPIQSPTNPFLPDDYVTLNTNTYLHYIVYQTELPWFDKESFAGTECPISRADVVAAATETNKLASYQNMLFIIVVLTFVIITLVGGACTIKFAWNDDDGKITKGEAGYTELKRFNYCKYCLKFSSYAAIIASILVAFGITGFFASLVEEYGGSGEYCSDDLTQKSMEKLGTIIDEISKKDAIAGVSQLGDFAAEMGQTFADKIVELIAGF